MHEYEHNMFYTVIALDGEHVLSACVCVYVCVAVHARFVVEPVSKCATRWTIVLLCVRRAEIVVVVVNGGNHRNFETNLIQPIRTNQLVFFRKVDRIAQLTSGLGRIIIIYFSWLPLRKQRF